MWLIKLIFDLIGGIIGLVFGIIGAVVGLVLGIGGLILGIAIVGVVLACLALPVIILAWIF